MNATRYVFSTKRGERVSPHYNISAHHSVSDKMLLIRFGDQGAVIKTEDDTVMDGWFSVYNECYMQD